MRNCPLIDVTHHVTCFFLNLAPNHIFGIGKAIELRRVLIDTEEY